MNDDTAVRIGPRILATVLLVSFAAIFIVAMVFVNGLHSSHVAPRATTDEQYCTLVHTRSLTDMVTVASTTPQWSDTVLAMMPNNGPADVQHDLAALRHQVETGQITDAMATARSLDARTASVCP